MTNILTPGALEAAMNVLKSQQSWEDTWPEESPREYAERLFRAAFDAAIAKLREEGRVTDETDSIDPHLIIWLLSESESE